MCHFFIRFEFHFVMSGDILLLLRYLSFVVTFEIANYLLRILAYKFILPWRLSYAIFLKNSRFLSLLLPKPKKKYSFRRNIEIQKVIHVGQLYTRHSFQI